MAEKRLEVTLGDLLQQRSLRLAVAESCTGGLVGHRITNVPGSSNYFVGGIVAYANQTKMRLLGVTQETLDRTGAVSRETALEMARGIRQAMQADIGASITGIAGPQGGTLEKPVGLTWIGLSAPGVEDAWSYLWSGDRLAVKEQSAGQVLRILIGYLSEQLPAHEKIQHSQSTGWDPMEAVEVTARFDEDGKIIPQKFTWRQVKYPVTAVGRYWNDDTGQHILVMTPVPGTPGDRVFELVYTASEGRWYINQPPTTKSVA